MSADKKPAVRSDLTAQHEAERRDLERKAVRSLIRIADAVEIIAVKLMAIADNKPTTIHAHATWSPANAGAKKNADLPPESLRTLRPGQAAAKVGLCERRLRELEAKGKFPKRFLLDPDGGRAKGYLESEIDAWLRNSADQRK